MREGERGIPGVRGDTLAVVMDLAGIDEQPYQLNPGYEPPRYGRRYHADRIVPGVLECVKMNAAQSFPEFQYVAVEVVGDPRFESLSGTYPLEPIAVGLHRQLAQSSGGSGQRAVGEHLGPTMGSGRKPSGALRGGLSMRGAGGLY